MMTADANEDHLAPDLAAVALVARLASCPVAAEEGLLGFETSSLSGNYLAGRYAGRLGDTDVAAEYFTQALRDDPEQPASDRAHLRPGDFHRATSRRRRRWPRSCSGFDSKHRLAQIVIGLKEFRSRRYDRAVELFRKSDQSPIGELSAGLLTAWTAAAERNPRPPLAALDRLDKNEAFTNFKSFHGGLIADLLESACPRRSVLPEGLRAGRHARCGSFRPSAIFSSARKSARKRRRSIASFSRLPRASRWCPTRWPGSRPARNPGRLIADAAEGVAEVMFSIASALGDDQTLDISLVYAQLALAPKKDFLLGYSLLGDIYEQSNRFDKAIEAYDVIAKNSALARQGRHRDRQSISIAWIATTKRWPGSISWLAASRSITRRISPGGISCARKTLHRSRRRLRQGSGAARQAGAQALDGILFPGHRLRAVEAVGSGRGRFPARPSRSALISPWF